MEGSSHSLLKSPGICKLWQYCVCCTPWMSLKFEASRLLARGGRAGRWQGQALDWLSWMLMQKSTPSNSAQALISTSPVSSSQLIQDKGSSISALYRRPIREVVPTSPAAPWQGITGTFCGSHNWTGGRTPRISLQHKLAASVKMLTELAASCWELQTSN